MKRIIISFLLVVTILVPSLALSGMAGAVDINPLCDKSNSSGTDASGTEVCKDVVAPTDGNPIIKIIKVAIEITSYVTGVAATIMLIVSGIQFATSNGDPGGVSRARSSVLYALIGVGVTLSAQSIIVFVLDKIK